MTTGYVLGCVSVTFPQKTPITTRLERVVVSVWNVCALTFVLTLCLLIWFSRLYNSWACVRSISEVLLLCQFTNLVGLTWHGLPPNGSHIQCVVSPHQVQCWQCVDAQRCNNLENCVLYTNNTFHCLSPVFTLGPPQVKTLTPLLVHALDVPNVSSSIVSFLCLQLQHRRVYISYR